MDEREHTYEVGFEDLYFFSIQAMNVFSVHMMRHFALMLLLKGA